MRLTAPVRPLNLRFNEPAPRRNSGQQFSCRRASVPEFTDLKGFCGFFALMSREGVLCVLS